MQPAILAPVSLAASILVFDLDPGADPKPGLTAIRTAPANGGVVVGLGAPLVHLLKAEIEGLRAFGGMSGAGVAFPSTQGALWLNVRGKERGEVLESCLALQRKLGAGWRLLECVDTFRYKEGRDLTGYEDGTENPKGEKAIEAAVIAKGKPGVVGGSFVAGQRYVHDLVRFEALTADARDAIIGRRISDNEEIPDAVATAHVKRSAQESFDPPAFMVRRSMAFGDLREHGLYFMAYVESLDRFERVLARMAGLEDGQVDGLLGITRATSGGYYFCPPMKDGQLDLRAANIATI